MTKRVSDSSIKATLAAARLVKTIDAFRFLAAFALDERDSKQPGSTDEFLVLVRHEASGEELVVRVVGEEVDIFLASEYSIPSEAWRPPHEGFWTDN
jgi:hypothetical protein